MDWYYVRGGDQTGPLGRSEIEKLITGREIKSETLVWHDGLDDWEPASQHFEIKAPRLPPPIPKSHSTQASVGRGTGLCVDGAGLGGVTSNPQSHDVPYSPRLAFANFRDELAQEVNTDERDFRAPVRSFTEAVRVCLKESLNFKGRASRSEYWYFYLFCMPFLWVISIFAHLVGEDPSWEPSVIVSLVVTAVSLVLTVSSLAALWRRLHDTDRSGWWFGGYWLGVMVIFIPLALNTEGISMDIVGPVYAVLGVSWLIHTIMIVVFLCQRGHPKKNRFG
jgi:uncharacterized membrane protein YhaH (DUF805 family)